MDNKYLINHIQYSQNELLAHAEELLSLPDVPDWERDIYSFVTDWFSTDEFISIFTSGSTGVPKKIRLTKKSMLVSALRTLEYFKIKPLDQVLLCLPVKYIAGMMMVVRAFAGKLNLVTISPKQLKLSEITEPIDFAAMVPLQVEKLLNEHGRIGFINKLILGGAPVSQSLANRINQSWKGMVWETYGMTETITHVAVRNIREEAQVFKALPAVAFSKDKRECLIISDPTIHAQPMITNDRVELLSETCFRLIGRLDHVINSGGIKVQPDELERILGKTMDGLFCITSLVHNVLGQEIVLVVEKGIDLQAVRHAIQSIDTYRQPKRIIELEKIPMTPHGKIDLIAVKNLIANL